MIRAGVGFSNALNPRTAAGEATAAAMQEAGVAQAQAASASQRLRTVQPIR